MSAAFGEHRPRRQHGGALHPPCNPACRCAASEQHDLAKALIKTPRLVKQALRLDEEIEAIDAQIKELTGYINQAQVQLDSLRLIVVSHN